MSIRNQTLYCLREAAPLESLFDFIPRKRYDRPDFAFQLAHGLRHFADIENDPRELAMRQPVRLSSMKKNCGTAANLLADRITGQNPKGL